VIVAALLSLVVALDEAAGSAPVFVVTGKALAVATAVLVVGAMAERLWRGTTVSDARLPGGAGLAFEQTDADVTELKTRLRGLDERVELRLIHLEREVFGSDYGGNGAA
jgi:hypothetical protein